MGNLVLSKTLELLGRSQTSNTKVLISRKAEKSFEVRSGECSVCLSDSKQTFLVLNN